MASITPYTFVSAPSPSSSSAKICSLPHRRFKSRIIFLASSSENGASAGESEVPDHVRLAFSKAEAYRKGRTLSSPQGPLNPKKSSMEPAVEDHRSGCSEQEVPIAMKIAVEKAEVYKKKKKQGFVEEPRDLGEEEKSLGNSRNGWVENNLNKKVELKISSKDFLGLDFSEKKSYRRNPPGLVPLMGPLLEDVVPEVEIIVGDASKFQKTERASTSFEAVDNTGLYKPKVSTWGVFPRPSNISKTFGGGRVIESGEMLETPEVKVVNEKRSSELISSYKKKMGLSVDTKTRAECEKVLQEGDGLMERGQLRGALPYYEKVMNSLVFQSDLHGLAALQWSICQDSLSRPNEARIMYEKLKSHPNAEVSKKARQFVFSFQAMSVMKVEDTSLPIKTGYEDYFQVFVDNKISYSPSMEEQNERVLEQLFPYLVFLLSPMLIILFIVVKKSI